MLLSQAGLNWLTCHQGSHAVWPGQHLPGKHVDMQKAEAGP